MAHIGRKILPQEQPPFGCDFGKRSVANPGLNMLDHLVYTRYKEAEVSSLTLTIHSTSSINHISLFAVAVDAREN